MLAIWSRTKWNNIGKEKCTTGNHLLAASAVCLIVIMNSRRIRRLAIVAVSSDGNHVREINQYRSILMWDPRAKWQKHSIIVDAHNTYMHSPLWTHTRTTYPMSTSDRQSRQSGSWDWRSHHGRLAIDGNVASHWKNIFLLYNTQYQTWDLNSGGLGVQPSS